MPTSVQLHLKATVEKICACFAPDQRTEAREWAYQQLDLVLEERFNTRSANNPSNCSSSALPAQPTVNSISQMPQSGRNPELSHVGAHYPACYNSTLSASYGSNQLQSLSTTAQADHDYSPSAKHNIKIDPGLQYLGSDQDEQPTHGRLGTNSYGSSGNMPSNEQMIARSRHWNTLLGKRKRDNPEGQ
ncbi:hypothetical protein K461DRAFT_272433 [Myriangium duriaei CBS 260.36]|uniref:Uncharacterized protein n=1 Tax=Myriangium duriaei CBS 260.36 TaxID=1168546 RepID=A0A9P4ITW5_9PEZI|nr:hypothetical protein K461DRAFT_272433 [Myriangium duriaei CBS 260.36]